MHSFRIALISVLIAVAPLATAQAEIRVVASIKPIHSLVSGVMAGVGTPALIVEGAGSPHTYSLKPSQAREMEAADMIFWVGHNLEPFLEKPLESLGAKAVVVELMETEGLTLVPIRDGGAFEGHDHDHGHGHGHADKEDTDHDHDHDHDHGHAKKKHDDHGHAAEKAHTHGEDGHRDHGHGHGGAAHGEVDGHIWLDPLNAKILVQEIARKLAAADPANASTYESNANGMAARIDAVSAEVAGILEPVRNQPFVVFHDAYQSFEKRFGLNAAGSITVSPEVVPGAARVQEIRDRIGQLGAVCVFSEPQFTPKLVSVVTEGTRARQGVLDPLGAGLAPGPELYFALLGNLADRFAECLDTRG